MIFQTKSNTKTYSPEGYAPSPIQDTHPYTFHTQHSPPYTQHTHKEAAPAHGLPGRLLEGTLLHPRCALLQPKSSPGIFCGQWSLAPGHLPAQSSCPVLQPLPRKDLFIISTTQSHPVRERGCLAAAVKAELSYLGINLLLNVVLQVRLWEKKKIKGTNAVRINVNLYTMQTQAHPQAR